MREVRFEYKLGRKVIEIIATSENIRAYRIKPKTIAGQEIARFFFTEFEWLNIERTAKAKLEAS